MVLPHVAVNHVVQKAPSVTNLVVNVNVGVISLEDNASLAGQGSTITHIVKVLFASSLSNANIIELITIN